MDDKQFKVLLIEDNPGDVRLIREMLAEAGGALYDLECADRLQTGLERLAEGGIDVILLDLGLPDSQGLDTLGRVLAESLAAPAVIVVLTGLDDEALAVQAVGAGAQDYLVKGQVEGNLLVRALRYAIERQRMEESLRQRNRELALLHRAGQSLTSSLDLDRVLDSVLEEVRRLLEVVACSVWLSDQTTGELVCRQVTGPKGASVRGWRLSPGEGLAGWVARHGESLIVPDVRSDERHFKGVDQQTGLELCSILSVPLRAKQDVIGVLQVVDTDLDRFTLTDLRLIEPLAATAAIAIENARLYQAERESRKRAEVLRQAAQAVGSSLELDEILRLILEQLKRALVYDTASVLILREGNVPDQVVGIGYTDEQMTSQESRRLLEDSPILRQMAHDLRPVVSADVRQLDGWIWVPGAEHVRSWLGVPLVARGRMIGVLMIDSAQLNAFGKAEVQMAQALAQHAAQAIENAQLFDEARRRAAHQEALNAAIAAAAAASDLPELLETALDSTLQALGLEMGGIWVADEQAIRGLSPEIIPAIRQTTKDAELFFPGPVARQDLEQVAVTGPPAVYVPIMGRFGIRASLTAPILVEGRRLGGLNVAAPESRRWSPEEVALVEAVGRQIGGAVERLGLLEKTQEQARQVQQIVDTVPEGMLLLDADLRVALANPLAREYLAVLADANVGDTLTQLGGRPLAELLTSPPQGLWHEVEIDGPPHGVFEMIARPMEAGPENEGWVLVIRDVTREREIQQRIQQRDRLAAVGQLAAGIAHDFNNIMAVIVLYTRMGLSLPDVPPQIRERLTTIDRQATRATDLVQQILDFSRRAVLERRPMDLVTFLKEQVRLLERTLPESIKIDLTYGMGEHMVNADPTRMQQVIMNLALNARDAMPEGGELHIGLERIGIEPGELSPLPEMEAGEWVRVTVTDTGTGIPPDVLPRIFEPFFTTRAPLGTGLGLAQVYGIVKQHEGHVDVTTKVGEGTTFVFYLPALPVSQPEESRLSKMPDLLKGQGETILVVEDNAVMREALADGLEMLNYQSLEAENGREALATFERHGDEIALVLSDLVMPEMGGIMLFHALRQRNPAVRVVILTGYPLAEEDGELRAQGIADWIQKPVDLEQLAEVMDRVLKKG